MPSFLTEFHKQETIAAIDLGSNALRALIVRRVGNQLEVLKNFRNPLRLGEDVFSTGSISPSKMDETEEAFVRLFHSFAEYRVTAVRALATSAMRDALNGKELIRRIKASTGIEIKTIDGIEEARLIYRAVSGEVDLRDKLSLLMDIGGGSTELTIVKEKRIIAIRSFNVGTIRLLQYLNQEELEAKIHSQVDEMLKFIDEKLHSIPIHMLVGTGGNLRRIGKIRKRILEKPTSDMALLEEVHHLQEAILSMSYVERIRKLELDQDRADVILPAILLTYRLMHALGLKKIHLPKVGLKEGIIISMLGEPISFM